MITFNNLILLGLSLRIIFVIIGSFYSFKIIGLKNIQFLKNYIKSSFFSIEKLFYWLITVFSIIYFEHLVSSADEVLLSDVYSKHWILTSIVIISLVGVLIYALIDAIATISNAKKTKKELNSAKKLRVGTQVASFVSFFVPGGLLVKVAIYSLSHFGRKKIDTRIEKTLSNQIRKTIEIMLIIAIVNLTIILISTYLITNQIIFW